MVANAVLLDIKRNSLDDGPGIRTLVMLKGCPLDCVWCHNPESKDPHPELLFEPSDCIGCAACEQVCPEGGASLHEPHRVERSVCERCFMCVETCPSGALSRIGETRSIDEVWSAIQRDMVFYRNSGGGLTLSGGEPTVHLEFCVELVSRCVSAGISTVLQTSGQFNPGPYFASLHPLLDHVYVDIKLMDAELHRRHCGVHNRLILENIERMAAAERNGEALVLPRVPLVPGLTDTDENLRGVAAFLSSIGIGRVALLPYNPTWHGKAARLGKGVVYRHDSFMTAASINRCRSFFDAFEIM